MALRAYAGKPPSVGASLLRWPGQGAEQLAQPSFLIEIFVQSEKGPGVSRYRMGFEPAGHCGKFMITSARAAPPTKVVSRRQGDDVAGPVELCGERHGRVVQLHREGQEAASVPPWIF